MRPVILFALALTGCSSAGYGEVCASDGECAGDLSCVSERCLEACRPEQVDACAPGWSCLSTREAGAIGVCVARCDSTAECLEGFSCTSTGSYCTVD
jgi:hypothetical protein